MDASKAERTAGGFDVALRYLQDQILDERYRDGDRLPPERELAVEIGVSRGAVREALRVLQAQGVIVSSTGPGNGTRIQAAPVRALGRLIGVHVALGSVEFDDLTETRIALERAAVRAAASHRAPEHLRAARAHVQAMQAAPDVSTFNRYDTDFHVALAEAGQHPLMRDLTVALRQAAARPIQVAETSAADWEGLRGQLVRQHEAVLDAVEAGEELLAAELVEHHIRFASRELGTR